MISVGYLRRSTTKQEMSLDGQREAVTAFAAQHGYTVTRWYIDDGISGASGDERPEFMRMISDAETLKDFKAVIAYDLSRFGRMDADETGFYRHRLKAAGVSIRFSNENDGGDNETGEIIRPVLQAQKRQYLRQISRDTLRGQVQSARNGWASGRAAAYGFDRMLVDETGAHRQRLKRGESYAKPRSWHITLVPSDTLEEVETVRWIYETYLQRELGMREMAKQLNEKGIKSPHGGTWCLGTIRTLIKNPVYKGDLVFGRRAIGSFHRLRNGAVTPADGNETAVMNRPEEEWVVHHKPEMVLISKEDWEAANEKMRSRGDRQKGARVRAFSYPLSGMVCCMDCGRKMVGMYRDKSYQIYACSSHFRNKACFSNTVRQENLLNVLKETIREHLFHGENWEALKTELLAQAERRPECIAKDRDSLRRDLEKVKAQHQRAAQNMLMADPENVPALNTAMNGLRQQIRSLEAQIQEDTESSNPAVLVNDVVRNAQTLLNDLFNEQGDRLKAVLNELVEKIELRYEWKSLGKRKLRKLTGGDFYLRPIYLTRDGRGDRTPIELFEQAARDSQTPIPIDCR